MDIPQSSTASPAPLAVEGPAPQPRQLGASEGAAWWAESWRIFCAAPGPWLAIVVIFVALSIALVFVPLVGSLVDSLLTPVFAGGVMLGCHALAKGRPLTVGHLFEGFQGGRFAPLAILGLLWLATIVVVCILMVVVLFVTLGARGVEALANLGSNPPIDYEALMSAGPAIAIVGLISLAIVLLVVMAYWFAPALVVLNGEAPIAALQKGFAASWRNFGAFLLYGLIYIGLAIVASIPLGLGWLVLGPMVVGSCYAGWRTIFGK